MKLRELNKYAEWCAKGTIFISFFMDEILFGSYILLGLVFVGGIFNSLKLKRCYEVMDMSKWNIILDEISYVGGLTFWIIMLNEYGDSDSPFTLLMFIFLFLLLTPWAGLEDRIKQNSCIVERETRNGYFKNLKLKK